MLSILTADAKLLFLSRFLRLFSYGMLAVVLVFHLTGIGLSESQTGLLLTLILAGDTAVSLALSTQADRWGRRRTLIAGALLMAAAGVAFAITHNFALLVLAGVIGVISPSGNEVGPFLAVEQAALSEVVPASSRTTAFAWYTLTGAFATASGSLFGGWVASALQQTAVPGVSGPRAVVVIYAVMGLALALVATRLSSASEVRSAAPPSAGVSRVLGLRESRNVILRISALFALDAFGGGFVIQSFAAYWFYLRFGTAPGTLGWIFFGANLLAGISVLVAARLAKRIGLVETMVFTHLPSNVLLILVPLMPNLQLAVLVLFLRFSISQMDVPTRQSYTMAIVAPDERSAAAGITGVARTVGAAIAPLFAGVLLANPAWIHYPFFLAGGLKILYDLLLYRAFIGHRPAGEH